MSNLIIIIIVLRVRVVSIWVKVAQAHTYLQQLISTCDGRLLFLEAFKSFDVFSFLGKRLYQML